MFLNLFVNVRPASKLRLEIQVGTYNNCALLDTLQYYLLTPLTLLRRHYTSGAFRYFL